MPRLVLIRDIMAQHKREIVPMASGYGVIDHVPPDFDLEHAQVIHNGRVIADKDFLKQFRFTHDMEEIILRIIPGDFIFTPAVLVSLALFAVSTALSFAIQALMPPPKTENKKRFDNEEESPTYGWDGIQNTMRNGSPIPLVFGKHKVAGQYLSTYTLSSLAEQLGKDSIDDGDDVLQALIGLSAGPICAINGVTETTDALASTAVPDTCAVNNNAISLFQDVEVNYRMGEWVQSLINGFNDTIIGYDQNVVLAYGVASSPYTTNDEVNGVDLLLTFPGGLYTYDANGSFNSYEVDILVEYQESGAAGWTTFDTITFSNKTRSTYKKRIRVEGLEPATYLFRLTRQTADDGTYESSEVALIGVNEIRYDDVANKGVACFGVKALATEQLHGRLPTFTNIIHGLECKVYRPGDQFTQDTKQDFASDQDKLLWGWYSVDDYSNRDAITHALAHTIEPNSLVCKHAAATSTYRTDFRTSPYWYKIVEADDGFDARVYADFLSTPNNGDCFAIVAESGYSDYGKVLWVGIRKDSGTLKWWVYDSMTHPIAETSGTAAAGERYFRVTFDGTSTWKAYTSEDGDSWTQRGSSATDSLPADDTTARVGLTYFSDTSSSGDLEVKFQDFEFADSTCYSTEVTNNPSWVAYYKLTNSHYGMGAYLSESNLDLDTFIDYAAYCNEMIADGFGSTHRRHVFDGVVDATRASWEQVLRMLSNYRATLLKQGDQIRVAWMRAQDPAQIFSMTNIKKETFVTTYQTPKVGANYWEIQFLNAENDYEQDYAVYVDPDIEAGEAQRRKTANMYGITRAAEAYRAALFKCKMNRYATQSVEFETGIDAVTVEPYDVIAVSHGVPQWGESGRVASGTSTTVTLDKNVTIAAQTSYEVQIRHANDTIETQTVTTAAGATNVLDVASWDSTPAEDDIWVFGELNISTKDFLVMNIKVTGELECQITAVEYNALMFDDTVTRIPTVKYTRLPDPRKFPSDVSGLIVTERAQRMKDGSIQNVLDVTFSKARDAMSYEVYYRESDKTGWQYAGFTAGTHFAIVALLKEDTQYDVAVVAVGPFGAKRHPDSVSKQSIEVVGKTDPPADVTGFKLSRIGDTLRFTWNAVADTDLLGYQLRYAEADNWKDASASVIAYRHYSTEYITSDFPDGTSYYFLIKAVNKSLIWSDNATSFQETVIEKPDQNILVSRDENALGWNGTPSNMTKDTCTGFLELDAGETSGSYTGGEMDAGAVVTAELKAELSVVLSETTYTWATATFTWGSATGLATTWVTNPEGTDMTPVLKFRYADTSPLSGDWETFQKGWYSGRYFQFKLEVDVESTAYTATVRELFTYVDPPDRFQSGTNEAIGASGTTNVTLTGFAVAPDVTVTPYSGSGGDAPQVVSVSSSQFGVIYYDKDGAQTSGYINWIARGY